MSKTINIEKYPDCPACNGKRRGWSMPRKECDVHNTCRQCKCTRASLSEPPWGGSNGWLCQPCAEADRLKDLKAAMKKHKDMRSYDFLNNDTIICPHCGTDNGCDDFHESSDTECHLCEKRFDVEVEYTASYSSTLTEQAEANQ
jgi:hypothetical protein